MSSPGTESPLPRERGYFVISPGEQISNKGLCGADVIKRKQMISMASGFPSGTSGKELAFQCRRPRDVSLIPGSGSSPGGGHSNPLQYSCLENPKRWTLVGYCSPGHKEWDTTEATQHTLMTSLSIPLLFSTGISVISRGQHCKSQAFTVDKWNLLDFPENFNFFGKVTLNVCPSG